MGGQSKYGNNYGYNSNGNRNNFNNQVTPNDVMN